ncbi:universal stress protein [Patiriisocius hiemis]|uniref:Universal stress protein n=1 Tax=Patiriisocius hiemis TaxID=3075604 RepID=A0ABU2YDC0_9FLAO|nr:universal stress protein [Constantimarinum sp. W242]MDT0556158.1 universal stress protein [Constantimarinum sp. W242]
MQTILIPTDFSKNAYCALHYATQLFSNETCEFIILHSFENQVSNLSSRVDIGKTEAIVNELYNTYEKKCDGVKHAIIRDNPNNKHTYKTIATSLSLARAINRLVLKENVDFVVMGSKGATGAASVFIGSNTLRMIKKIKKTPLLIIPQELNFTPIKKIAFTTGFKRDYTAEELHPLVTIGESQNAIVKVVHIREKEKMIENQRAHLHQLLDLLKPLKPKLHWLHDTTDKYYTVTSYLNKENVELLAMVYYKHNFFISLFREAVVKNIAEYSPVPFLILPSKS